MAKGTGLIGNFKGKVGNMVGYNLKDSNNKQTQGIRVYQPVVRNPKSYAQAQQRCIMKPINDFYRALKPVISRGQEGKAYGNASRLAWLRDVMKDFNGPWLVKGSTEQWPIACKITNGSLSGLTITEIDSSLIGVEVLDGAQPSSVTIGNVSERIKGAYPSISDGDQITFVAVCRNGNLMTPVIKSFVIDTTSTEVTTDFAFSGPQLNFGNSDMFFDGLIAGSVIVSREANNGGHLRSQSSIMLTSDTAATSFYKATAKATAIASYMAAGANTDWPQEALEG